MWMKLLRFVRFVVVFSPIWVLVKLNCCCCCCCGGCVCDRQRVIYSNLVVPIQCRKARTLHSREPEELRRCKACGEKLARKMVNEVLQMSCSCGMGMDVFPILWFHLFPAATKQNYHSRLSSEPLPQILRLWLQEAYESDFVWFHTLTFKWRDWLISFQG